MKKIRWGIIGCGDVTEIKSGPGFQKADGSELVAVMRRNRMLAEDYAHRHRVPKWYDNADALINDSNVDAVYIATPPSSHKEYTLAVALARKPVYVEKPMALNYSECIEMVKTCSEKNVPLFVAYYRRALPRFLKIKSFLDEKAVGEIKKVRMTLLQPPSENDLRGLENWRVNPAIAGCGYFCDLASHMIDLIQFYFGKITKVSGTHSNIGKLYQAEDTVAAEFEFENGIKGSGNWSFFAKDNIDLTEIIGTNGKIIYSNFSNSPISLIRNNYHEQFEIQHPKHVAQPLIQKIVDELLGGEKSPSTGKTGALTSWVIDRILGRI
jgi:predicted dehydrogenase